MFTSGFRLCFKNVACSHHYAIHAPIPQKGSFRCFTNSQQTGKITHRYLKGHLLQINKSRNVFNSHCLCCKIYHMKTRRLHSRFFFVFCFFVARTVFFRPRLEWCYFSSALRLKHSYCYSQIIENLEYFPLAMYRGIKYAA